MPDTLTTIELAWNAVLRFLRSAVALDDKPVRSAVPQVGEVHTPPEVALLEPERSRAPEVDRALPIAQPSESDDRLGVPADPGSAPPDAEEGVLNEDTLVEAFADLGIACAVLKPNALGTSGRQALMRADVLILDWRLGVGEDGALAIELLQSLADHPKDTGQRIVAIYTSMPDLERVRNAILAEVVGADADQSESHTLRFGAVTVMVIGKESVGGGVAAGDLPSHLVQAFARAIEGIVPTATVNALAAVRDGLPGLIARLGRELDRGYVRHCLLLEHADEGSAHLTALIGDELGSMVQADAKTKAASGVVRLGVWLDEQEAVGGLTLEAAKIRAHIAGETRISNASGSGASTRKPHYVIRPALPDHSDRDDELLAERMTFRAMRFDQSAAMVPGVVLRRDAADGKTEYFVCIQPSCDAVRLDPEGAELPFLPCEQTTGGFDFVLFDGMASVRLKVVDRFDRLVRLRFPVDAASRVIKLVDPLVQLNSDGTPGEAVRVVGVLRDEYARRLGQQMGNRLGRMGLDESEWQRRKGKF